MSEQITQHGSIHNMGHKMGNWTYYILGATNLDHLVQQKIIQNKDYLHLSRKKPDNILVSSGKKVFAVIETKIPKTFVTPKQQQQAIDQELEVAKILGARVYIATDGKQSLWVNPQTGNRILDEQGHPLIINRNHLDEKMEKLLIKIQDSISDHNDQIKEKQLVDPSGLAKSIRQDIRSVSGATPENCLYTFVELFIFKYLSDLGILQNRYCFEFLMEMYKNDTSGDVLEYYASNIRKRIKTLFPENPKDHTTIINGTIFVSKDDKAVEGYSAVFKKVLEKFRDYGELRYIDHDFKSKLFESFLKESISKKNRGQYFTPLKVVRAMVKMADIKPGMKIGDPACGVGKFLLETVLDNVDKFYEVKNGKLISNLDLVGYDKGFDKDEQKTIILAKANMLIYFCDLIKEHKDDEGITQQFAELFNHTFTLKTNSILGTLRDPVQADEKYDVILTNPPYVVSGSSNLKEEIKKAGLSNDYHIGGIGIEGLFMEWIIKGLKPGGQALVVVPDGFLIRQNDKNLRRYMLEQCYLDAIISLPLKTFFTTTKKTYILVITKKHDIQKEKQSDPVFTYLVSEVGETLDVYRFDKEENHLNDAVDMYNFYKAFARGEKSKLKQKIIFNADPRCKLQDIELFDPENHWAIDRRWSHEEKLVLGVVDKQDTATIDEFHDMLGEIADNIKEFQSLLKLQETGEKKNEQKFVTIQLNNNQYFDLFIGKRILKKDIRMNTEGYPIYSANVQKPIGYISETNVNGFDHDCIVWGIDGYFDLNIIPAKIPFATTDHCGTIRIKNKQLSIGYLVYEFHRIKKVYGFDRALRSSLKNIEQVEIQIPIDENGNFDLLAQQEIASSYILIDEFKKQLSVYQERIEQLQVIVDDIGECTQVQIDEIFDIIKGKSIYTKSYGTIHKGDFPVYSASNNKPLTFINSYDFDGKYITRATNGFAGYVKVIEGKFSINGDRGILVDKKSKYIDIYYIKYVLEPLLRSLALGRKGDNSENEFTKVYPNVVQKTIVPIPILPDGSFDLVRQQEIAHIYETIASIKMQVAQKLQTLQDIQVIL